MVWFVDTKHVKEKRWNLNRTVEKLEHEQQDGKS